MGLLKNLFFDFADFLRDIKKRKKYAKDEWKQTKCKTWNVLQFCEWADSQERTLRERRECILTILVLFFFFVFMFEMLDKNLFAIVCVLQKRPTSSTIWFKENFVLFLFAWHFAFSI